MAINFHLVDRRSSEADDPMHRHWYGWDPNATDEELWETNRGVWRIRSGPITERFATLSYGGVIQVVAEISGREQYGVETALVGTVLQPGDPVRDELVNRPAPKQRNPVSYLPTPDLDKLDSAHRSRTDSRTPVTMLATWNPAQSSREDWEEEVAATKAGGIVRSRWSTGGRTGGIEPGDRVFLLRQRVEPRGILASGTCSSRIFQDGHWDDARADQEANYVLIEWDTVVDEEAILAHQVLAARIPEGGWSPQGSGTVLTEVAAEKLERLWAEHLQQPVPVPPRTSPRQGWQLDPERRKKVEDAAQARLEGHFRSEGWEVKDVRHGNSYDAIASKPGEPTLFLEAKGTETAGASVIVSKGEVAWARAHAGQCFLGILSDVRFLSTGEVDPDSGTFRVVDWAPDLGRLSPRHYDWTPPDGTSGGS